MDRLSVRCWHRQWLSGGYHARRWRRIIAQRRPVSTADVILQDRIFEAAVKLAKGSSGVTATTRAPAALTDNAGWRHRKRREKPTWRWPPRSGARWIARSGRDRRCRRRAEMGGITNSSTLGLGELQMPGSAPQRLRAGPEHAARGRGHNPEPESSRPNLNRCANLATTFRRRAPRAVEVRAFMPMRD
mgnify:CR=1 FL=1